MNNHDAHVELLKQDLYSFISDASKDANGSRRRLNVQDYTVVELEELADYYSEQAQFEAERQEREYVRRIAHFEKMITSVIENGAGNRETAIRWFRDANKDSWMGDESIRFDLGLPWDYDFDYGDRDFFKRQAAKAA
jgi:hypothetical protein